MMKRATTLLTVLLLLTAGPAWAQQQVTIDQINQLDQDALQQLQDGGADLTASEIDELVPQTQYNGEKVIFTAVILSDPYKSGLATFDEDTDNDGNPDAPGRIHVFVRDTSAVSQGKGGMDLQVVESFDEDTFGNLLEAEVGEVYDFAGTVTYFGRTIQFDPSAIESVGDRADLGLPASLMDPVAISTAEANKMLDGEVQFNWSNFNDLNNQYVRFENASILDRTIADDGRPNWIFTTDGGDTYVENYDHSLRYRNDQDAYEPPFEVRDKPFRPPAQGSVVNVQGFLNVNTDFEAFSDQYSAVPDGASFHLSPFADSDLEVLETPTVSNVFVSSPSGIPESSETITINVDAKEGTVGDVNLRYVTSANPTDTTTVEATSTGDATYEATIDGIGDGEFVTYFGEVTDTDGAVFTSLASSYRVLSGGIDEISDIQQTASGGPGPSPFAGDTLDMDITAVVQSHPDTSGILAIQDDPDLAPWTGIFVQAPQGLNAINGDEITITRATVTESPYIEGFDDDQVTQLTNVEAEVTTADNSYGYKTITTSALQQNALAEQYEGMMLRFEDVTVLNTNPDAPDNFGAFLFTDSGEDAALRADDVSNGIPFGFNDTLSVDQEFDYIRGAWTYAFGARELFPEVVTDVGGLSLPAEELPGGANELALQPNYPNPFSEATNIRYSLDKAGDVQLSVYDLLGRKVATLVNERQAPGAQAVTFEVGNLPSGLYFLRLKAGDRIRTQKMTLVR